MLKYKKRSDATGEICRLRWFSKRLHKGLTVPPLSLAQGSRPATSLTRQQELGTRGREDVCPLLLPVRDKTQDVETDVSPPRHCPFHPPRNPTSRAVSRSLQERRVGVFLSRTLRRLVVFFFCLPLTVSVKGIFYTSRK